MTVAERRGWSLTLIAVAVIAMLVHASPSLAQTQTPAPASQPTRSAGRGIHLDVGGTFLGPASIANRDANLLAPDGSALTVTRTRDNRIGPGFGLEAHLGTTLSPSFAVEATGSWTRVRSSMRVSFDIEDAELLTASITSSQFTTEGAALWTFRRRGTSEWFIRGAGGWTTEVAGGVVIGKGVIASAGAGVRRWMGAATPARRGTRLGWRLEGRVIMRAAGFADEARTLRVFPLIAGGLMMGF